MSVQSFNHASELILLSYAEKDEYRAGLRAVYTLVLATKNLEETLRIRDLEPLISADVSFVNLFNRLLLWKL